MAKNLVNSFQSFLNPYSMRIRNSAAQSYTNKKHQKGFSDWLIDWQLLMENTNSNIVNDKVM